MTNTKSTKRALLTSVMALFLCFAMLLGTTYAWFTDSVSSANNIIQSGNLDVVLEYKTNWENDWITVDENTKIFKEGVLYEPGYTEVVYLRVSNAGSLALQYNLNVNVYGENTSTNVGGETFSLKDYLEIGYYVQDEMVSGYNYADILIPNMFGTREAALKNVKTTKLSEDTGIVRADAPVLAGSNTAQVIAIVLTMPETVGNEANHRADVAAPRIDLGVTLVATQFNHEKDSFGSDYDADAEYPKIPDKWDGTADTSWYNDTDTTFTLATAEQIAGLADLVDSGNTFAGKTITLSSDLNLYAEDANGNPICFEPIGGCRDEVPFMGTFDGQGHTISNMNQNTWALNNGYYYSGELGIGFFGGVEDAVIKNLVVDGAALSGESALCGAVAGVAMGDCTFENITVKNAQVNDYQYGAGGIVGWASGNQTYKGIHVDETTVVGSQWGDFGNANGGIIGQASPSGTYHFEDCTVACRIDATNDIVSAYQWYSYRNSGMLIGKVDNYVQNEVTSVVAENVTCKNVTVIYNDWANYTYCEFAGTGYPYVRVQAGVSVDGYTNVRYGHPTDANGNTVVDDNHVHNDGEDHHLLLRFDQLFGGPANHRYCYYGIATHDGVTVIYNNK